MGTTPSTAAEYAAHLQARIIAESESDAPFGYVNRYDDNTADTLDEIPDYDADEHDADNLPGDWERATGYDYVTGALDIRYVVDGGRDYRDAEICISLGGPNVWIHTATREAVVSWAFETARCTLPTSYVEALDAGASEVWDLDR